MQTMKTPQERYACYSKLVEWARKRYSYQVTRHGRVKDRLELDHGGVPTPYTRLERAAWDRYVKGVIR